MLDKLKTVFILMTILELAMVILVVVTPLRSFSGGTKGFYSLTYYNISFYDEPLKVDLFLYIRLLVIITTITYALIQAIVIFTHFHKNSEVLLGVSFVSIFYYGILKGFETAALNELSKIPTTLNMSTMAGKVVFPPTTISTGFGEIITAMLPFIIITRTGIAFILYLFLPKQIIKKSEKPQKRKIKGSKKKS
jgi:hypothetical protein